MKPPTLLVQLCAAVVLVAPLSLPGAMNDETVKDLKLTQFVEPLFPDSVRLEGVAEGEVTLGITRNAAGEPVDILVLASTHPRLAEAAIEAVQQWRFTPDGGPFDSAPRIVRLGFRYDGVIIYPTGKRHLLEPVLDLTEGNLRRPEKVPALQSLARVPKALAQAMPVYPAVLAARGLEGTAAVRFYVDEEGRVRLPEVVEATAPEFAAAAVAAVSHWRYEPPRNGGHSAVVRERWAFQFKAAN